ncbi:hypothetical protein DM860_017441 [Cuscuta australis]|uniref:Uncharacterized protein n=1 Tax=Cuscuta australis TaxID=267555 RepID=A0A328DEV2_9ASTE|nr:hypothetical protein DM860_017441 [Cuscuta australis]
MRTLSHRYTFCLFGLFHTIIIDKQIVLFKDSVKSKVKKIITQTLDLDACEDSTKDDTSKNHDIDACFDGPNFNMKQDLRKEFEAKETHLTKKTQRECED